tara:strand:- start:375 stop:842 length:468 start_codon:yes stop_codon:yes gene_type:complete
MKNIILLISILLVVSCGKGKEAQTKTKVTEDNNTKPIKVDDNATKPVKELTLEEQGALREKVIGEYENTEDGDTLRAVFLENGVVERYDNGKKDEVEYKWKISKEGEIHVEDNDGDIAVFSINKDESITRIASIDKDGERIDTPKGRQFTLKKIK